MVKFEWDENKNQTNIQKHGISFEEATTVFEDTESLIMVDENHSDNEDRFTIIGYSFKANLLVVCHCYRLDDSIIRIISARKAEKGEINKYFNKK